MNTSLSSAHKSIYIVCAHLVLSLMLVPFYTLAQDVYTIRGKIIDTNSKALAFASVAIHELQKSTLSDDKGNFSFHNIPQGQYHLHISLLGYKNISKTAVNIDHQDYYAEYQLESKGTNLNEVVIAGTSTQQRKRESSAGIEIIDKSFIHENINSSLMKSLESLPGISAIEVGQGFAKPVIRGLSFNRVAVTDNGIKQEGQQWGTDHGLEIDQMGIENIEIIKGPASLIYGSDAIGGVVQIKPNSIPNRGCTENELQLIGKSLNMLYGLSAMSKYRANKWHYYLRYTQMKFGDYKVPADSFFYNRYRLPIVNRTLKNTAGHERDIAINTGLITKHIKSLFTISHVHSKTGFFPGSHGIPNPLNLTSDGDDYNIGLPFQTVRHLKVMNKTELLRENNVWEINVGFQENKREEWSKFHTHYPNQEAPLKNPDLELGFLLRTTSADIKHSHFGIKSILTTGISTQYINNKIRGYMFLLPEYNKYSAGAFIYDKYNPSPKLMLNGGIRFDYGRIAISSFYSPYTHSFKSQSFTAHFYDISWALGLSYTLNNKLSLKSNIGKSFRMPNASELSANGIHHGSFRYELGDSNIVSEYAYQLDLGLLYATKNINIEISPFVNYFPNFIFLNPTGSYLHPHGYDIQEADAGQVYQYVQSQSVRAGIDYAIRYQLNPKLSFYTSGQYVYATDLKYPIPFTPPLALHNTITYSTKHIYKHLKNNSIKLSHHYTAAQNRNARNELATPTYHIWDFSASTTLTILKQSITFAFQIQNLLNTKYFNHISFYRLIELPEAGRNYQLMIKIPFQNNSSTK